MDTHLNEGVTLAGYRVQTLLGRGGMSSVYLAEEAGLLRPVALKVLSPELAEDDGFRSRFVRESRLASSIDHPNIVPVYSAGEHEGLLYIAMRYVPGTDLRGLLNREGALEPGRALQLLTQVAQALDAAHRRDLVHRDVKPGNILIAHGSGAEHVYLADFGLTKSTVDAPSVTQSGSFIGTPYYAAPEQIQGGDLDARTDVYALGCVLFECLSGAKPYEGATALAVLDGHLRGQPPPLAGTRSGLSRALDDTLRTALAKRPGDRFTDCMQLVDATRRALVPPGGSRRAQPKPDPSPDSSPDQGQHAPDALRDLRRSLGPRVDRAASAASSLFALGRRRLAELERRREREPRAGPPPFVIGYQSLAARAHQLTVVLLANVVLDLVALVGSIRRLATPAATADPLVVWLDRIGVFQGLLFVFTAAMFLVWFHRSYRNLDHLGAQGLRFGPGWAVGAWFVPVVNLYRPKQLLNDIWRASDPDEASAQVTMWLGKAVPASFTVWWGAFLASVLLGWGPVATLVSTTVLGSGASEPTAAERAALLVAASAASVVAALLATRVVRTTTARQEARLQRLMAPSTPVT